MIIGNEKSPNNNQFLKNNFNKKPQQASRNINTNINANINLNTSLLTKDIKNYQYSNPLDNNDMSNKSLAMVKDRYEKGLISLEEFQKKCETIRKNREKY